MLQNAVADARRRARRTLSALQAAKVSYGAMIEIRIKIVNDPNIVKCWYTWEISESFEKLWGRMSEYIFVFCLPGKCL